MLGCADFCGHYEWTFTWIEAEGGHELLREYWDEGIHRDSQRHARELILSGGIDGLKRYWAHTLDHEAAGFAITHSKQTVRMDMHDCPSKGFLLRNGLQQHCDYCDHCVGWIGPLMKDAGLVIDHEHNHLGQCWWEMRAADDPTAPSQPGSLAGERDVRLMPEWQQPCTLDVYERAVDPDVKRSVQA
jgi:hypothetical protein